MADWPRGHDDFEPGNTYALNHGAYSPRTWKPLADRLAADLVEVAPWTARDAFRPAVAAWSRTEAQIRLVEAWLDEHGPLTEHGAPRSATDLLIKLEGRALNLRAQLGLDPSSLAKLLRDCAAVEVAVDGDGLEALAAEGRRIRLEAEQRAALAAGSAGQASPQAPEPAGTADDTPHGAGEAHTGTQAVA